MGPIDAEAGGVAVDFFTAVRIFGINYQTWDPVAAAFSTAKAWTWAADQPTGNDYPIDEWGRISDQGHLRQVDLVPVCSCP